MLRIALRMTVVIGALAVACVSGTSTDPSNNEDGDPRGTGAKTSGTGAKTGSGNGGTSNVGQGGAGTSTGGSNVGQGGTNNPGSGGGTNGGGDGNTGNTSNSGGSSNTAGSGPLCGDTAPEGKGRCESGKVVAKATSLTVANFEEPSAEITDANKKYLGMFFGDGRSGPVAFDSAGTGANASTLTTIADSGVPGSTRALHFYGSAPGTWGANIRIEPAKCYDASKYRGLSFYIKGDASKGNSEVKLSLHTPLTQPKEYGGGCTKNCYDHYAKVIPITGEWKRHILKWSDFKPNCVTQADYKPESEIIMISFSLANAEAGFDIKLDDVTFDTGDLTSNGFSDIVSKDTFEEMWTEAGKPSHRKAPFTYEALLKALERHSVAGTGTAEEKRRDAAGFLANIAWETSSLSQFEEVACADDKTCTQYGSMSGVTCHGRGAIQLTLCSNYTEASNELGIAGIASNPESVATDPNLAFLTSAWFWNTNRSGGKGVCRDVLRSQGFGATIRIINGGLECGGGKPTAVEGRIKHFKRFCAMLGVNPGANLGC